VVATPKPFRLPLTAPADCPSAYAPNGGAEASSTFPEKFTELETSPRTGINASKNRPFSYNTLDGYKVYYKRHIKDDPVCGLKMAEVEEEDILEFITRLSMSKLKDGRVMSGTRIFVLLVSFMRTAFKYVPTAEIKNPRKQSSGVF
jgi:hypothetical protein